MVYFKKKMNKKEQFSDLIIFTTTLYGDDRTSLIRVALAEELFTNAKRLGIKCAVVDGGSSEGFLEKIKRFDNVKLTVNRFLGMGESRRRALREAMKMIPIKIKSPNFLWIEPEKSGLIIKRNLNSMIKNLRNNQADIVVPLRKSKKSYPKFQVRLETRANKRAMKIADMPPNSFRGELDLWFGPKMFNKTGARYFLDYNSKLDKWDATIKPVINAYKDKKRIVSIPVDFVYDKIQRQDEEKSKEFKRKRIEQYFTILKELRN